MFRYNFAQAMKKAQSILHKNPRAHIGLVRLSALGDAVMWVSVVQAIQRAYPQAAVTWITSASVYPLLKDLDRVRFIVLKKGRTLAQYAAYYQQLKAERFDILLAGQASMRAHILYPMISARLKIGFGGVHARDGHAFFIRHCVSDKPEHLLLSFMRFAQALGVADVQPRWNMPVSLQEKKQAIDLLEQSRCNEIAAGPWIVLNPSASKPERNWPTDRYIALLKVLRQRWDARLVITGGVSGADIQLAAQIAAPFGDACVNLAGKTSLKLLAAVLGQASLVIAPDTGPMHLATAMGVPVIGLHAQVPASRTGSYLWPQLAVDYYAQALGKLTGKKQDNAVWGPRLHDRRAMEEVPVGAVVDKVEQALQSLPVGGDAAVLASHNLIK